MAVIYLIRHGQASFGQQNYDNLSQLGHQQAAVLGASLKHRVGDFSKVVMGSMLRHKQTMQQCLFNMEQISQPDATENLHVNIDANWNEYDHNDILAQVGPEFHSAAAIEQWVRAQNDPKAAFEELFNRAMNRWMSGASDADYIETWQAYQQRVRQALSSLVANSSSDDTIAVFSSGGPISVIAQSLLGVDATKVMQVNWTLVNAGLTKLISTPSRLFLSTLNDHSHFEGQQRQLITYK